MKWKKIAPIAVAIILVLEETIAEASGIEGRGNGTYGYDPMISGSDADGDGIIEFVISEFDGNDDKKVCTVKCSTDKSSRY